MAPWPKYLQVRLHKESETDRTGKGRELTDRTTTDDDAHESLNLDQHSHASSHVHQAKQQHRERQEQWDPPEEQQGP